MCIRRVTQPVSFISGATGSEANTVGYPSLALKLQGFCEDAVTLEQQVLR
jgi:hypothetical protein